MTTTNSKQMTTGKSFEYALLIQFEEKLKYKTNLEVIKNSAFEIAKGCFENVSKTEQSEYLLSASFAVNFLMDIEPRLSNDIGKDDILQLEILSDQYCRLARRRSDPRYRFFQLYAGLEPGNFLRVFNRFAAISDFAAGRGGNDLAGGVVGWRQNFSGPGGTGAGPWRGLVQRAGSLFMGRGC